MAIDKINPLKKMYSLCENIIFAIRLDCCMASVSSSFDKKGGKIIFLSIVTQAEQDPHKINIHPSAFTKLDGGGGTGDITCGSKSIAFLLIQTDNRPLA
jgi:hypothetical protein